MEKLVIAGFTVLAVAAALLVCGPYMAGIVDKRKEWEEIMDASQHEK